MTLFDVEESAQVGITGGAKPIEELDQPVFDTTGMAIDGEFGSNTLNSFKKKKPKFGGFQ
jgi:hypothetical protein